MEQKTAAAQPVAAAAPVSNDAALFAVMHERKSIRSYQPTAMSNEAAAAMQACVAAPIVAPFHSNVRAVLHQGQMGTFKVISGEHAFLLGCVDLTSPSSKVIPKNDAAIIDYGYVLERAVLEAQRRGLGTCWIGGTFHAAEANGAIKVGANEKAPAVIAIGVPKKASERGWFERAKEKFMRGPLGADNRVDASKLFFFEDFTKPLTAALSSPQVMQCIEAVRIAPSASNKQPWRIVMRKEQGKVRFYFFRALSSRFYSLLDTGIGMYHWQAMNEALGRKGHWEECEAAAVPDMKKPKEVELMAVWVEDA